MTSDRRRVYLLALAWSAAVVLVGALPAAGQPAPPPSQEEFVPVTAQPSGQQLPAAAFLVTAYVVAWAVLLGYVWSLWRRIGGVARDLDELTQRLTHQDR
jgi:CcmD family protein